MILIRRLSLVTKIPIAACGRNQRSWEAEKLGREEARKEHGERRIMDTIPIKKFWEVQEPFFKRVPGRRRQSAGEFRIFLFLDILPDFF